MKMTKEHYQAFSNRLQETITKIENFQQVSISKIVADCKEYGLSPMRIRWDLLWTARIVMGEFASSNPESIHIPVYNYLNDDHIDTALRRFWSGVDSWAAQK